MPVNAGSSPLTRGKQNPWLKRTWAPRLIPAHAGKTEHREPLQAVQRAHPRSRGENPTRPGAAVRHWGSSPLTRGKPHCVGLCDACARLIPAHAGKTSQSGTMRAGFTAHPRSRGENAAGFGFAAGAGGSSPLTRGKPCRAVMVCGPMRLIPAHAGKTLWSRPPTRTEPAHPRSRGENLIGAGRSLIQGGSSPLTRGKPSPGMVERVDSRLIPAHAGKTCVCFGGRGAVSAHPRSRGENTF